MINVILHGFKFVTDGLSYITSWVKHQINLININIDDEFNIDHKDIEAIEKKQTLDDM